jgi:4-amino-4-deoxy-L-arabinose transferase-like glycosyltransferase
MHFERRLAQKLLLVTLLLLALLLRMGYLSVAPRGVQFTHVDARGYHWLAINLLERGVFSMNTEPPYRPDNIRTPLYPLFVALWYAIAGPDLELVMWAQALVDVLTVAMLYRLARRVAGERVAWLAALLYALNPSSWRFCNELLTEILFGLLLTSATWLFTRYLLSGRSRDAWGSGVLLGLAILCKPNVQFLPLVLLLILVRGVRTRRRGWWQGVAIILLTTLALLAPWVIRNRIVFGEWFYTRTFEDNLAHVSAVSTLAEVQGERVAPWTERWERLYEQIVVRTARRYDWERLDASQLSPRERDARLLQTVSVAEEIIRDHPVDFFVAHTRAWLRSFIPQEHKFWYTRLTGEAWPVLPAEGDALSRAWQALRRGAPVAGLRILVEERLLALPPLALALWLAWGVGYIVAALLFAVGLVRLRPRILTFFFATTIFYVTFVPGPISQIRFRLPVMPLIFLAVATGALRKRSAAG